MSERAALQTKAAPVSKPPANNILQRQCACGQHTIAGGECEACSKKRLQRRAAGRDETEEVPPIVYDVLRSPGQPLDAGTRAFFEPRFHHDFSHVRVHTDARAGESTRAVNALAYTVGRHIVLGDGHGFLSNSESRKTLAHELAHSVQQGGNDVPGKALNITPPNDSSEREAEIAAEMIIQDSPSDAWSGHNMASNVQSQPSLRLSKTPHTLQRQLASASSSVHRTVVVPYTEGGIFASSYTPYIFWKENFHRQVESTCLAIKEITTTGEVHINGGCAQAKTAITNQQQQEAVLIASYAAWKVRDELDAVFQGFCRDRLDPSPPRTDASGLREDKPTLTVSLWPPQALTPATALSMFPQLRMMNNVEVEIKGN